MVIRRLQLFVKCLQLLGAVRQEKEMLLSFFVER